MSYMDSLLRNEQYSLMGAIRGPDALSTRGMYDLKSQITARMRAITFSLIVSSDGSVPDAKCLPGDEVRTEMTARGFSSAESAIRNLDGVGGRHYLNHLLDPFERVNGFIDLPIWGGYGQKIKNALVSRIKSDWNIPNIRALKESCVLAHKQRDNSYAEVTKLKTRIAGLETEVRVRIASTKANENLAKAIMTVVNDPSTPGTCFGTST